MKITIYGASDDLIEVEGDIHEEFSHYTDVPFYIGISDGTVLRVGYDGLWNISVLRQGSGCIVEHHKATDEDADYSDKLTLEWDDEDGFIFGGEHLAKRRKKAA